MNGAERFRALTEMQQVKANLRQKSVRAVLFTAVAGFGDFAIRMGSTALLARLIIPEHFGMVMMVTALISVAEQIRDLGLSSATVQREHITHEQVSNLFWINLGISALIAAVLCLASPLVAAYYHEPLLIGITCTLASTIVFGGAMVQHQALLTRQLKLGQTSSVRLLTSVASTLLAVALALGHFGYWALVWREIARAALLMAGMWWCFPWIPGLPSRRTNVRGLLRFGADLTGANMLATLAASADRFLLGRLWGAAPVAVYRQSYQLVAAPTDQLLSPLYQVTQPTLSMLQSDPARYRRFYLRLLTLVCIITMPLSLFVSIYADGITALLLGPKWMAAAPVLCVLSFSTFIKQAVCSSAFVLITRGKSGGYLGVTVLHNAVLVLAMGIGVRWGILGVAVAEVATTYLLIGPRLYYSLRGSPVTSAGFFATLVRPVVASLVMSYALLAVRWFSTTALADNLAFGVAVATIAFGGSLLLIPGGKSELHAVLSDIRAALRRKAAAAAPAPAAVAAN